MDRVLRSNRSSVRDSHYLRIYWKVSDPDLRIRKLGWLSISARGVPRGLERSGALGSLFRGMVLQEYLRRPEYASWTSSRDDAQGFFVGSDKF